MKRPASAIWCVDKPVGATSSSLVEQFRNEYAGPWALKVSHGGALDPFANGLVLLLVGAANRLFEAIHEAPKAYVATVKLGLETDTGDAGGREVLRGAVNVSADAIDAALATFVGWTEQTPPATSNKRVGGERAYVRAHRGEQVELPAQRVYCHSARRIPHADQLILELTVRGGFYVRSLAIDLGRKLGCGAHLTALQRTHIGPWSVTTTPRAGRDVLPWLPSMELTDHELGAIRRGEALPARALTPPEWPLPEGFPPPTYGPRAFHLGKLVAVGTTLLPGGV